MKLCLCDLSYFLLAALFSLSLCLPFEVFRCCRGRVIEPDQQVLVPNSS